MDAVDAEVLSTRGHDIPVSFGPSRTFTIPSTMQGDVHSCYLRLGTVTREKSESVRGERRPPNVFWVTRGGIRGNERGHSLMLESHSELRKGLCQGFHLSVVLLAPVLLTPTYFALARPWPRQNFLPV